MDYLLTLLVFLSLYALLAYAMDVAVGHAGLLAVGIGAYYAVGAYVSSLLTLGAGWGFWPAAAVACAAGGLLGLALAAALLRTSGDYLFLASIGLQIIVVDVLGNLDGLTGGPHGLAGIPKPALPGWAPPAVEQALAYALVAAVCVLLMQRVLGRGWGVALRAARDDEIAAAAFGKQVGWLRARALSMGCAAAALAGAMYAHHVSYIDPSSFAFHESIYVLSMIAIGGSGARFGPLAGAAVLLLLPEALRFVGTSAAMDANIRQALYGALLVAFAFLRPQGLLGARR